MLYSLVENKNRNYYLLDLRNKGCWFESLDDFNSEIYRNLETANKIKEKISHEKANVECLNCHLIFQISTSSKHKAKFCSRKCVDLYKIGKPGASKGKKHKIDAKSRLKGRHPKGEFKKGNKPWNTGKTKESDPRVKLVAEKNIGHKVSKEARHSISIKLTGRPTHGPSWGKGGIREDIGHFVRSRWEANICRILNLCGVRYEYEKHRFKFESFSYCPDFYLPELDMYIEVKGYLSAEAKRNLKIFVKAYPSINLKVIDGENYTILKQKFKELIKLWEE